MGDAARSESLTEITASERGVATGDGDRSAGAVARNDTRATIVVWGVLGAMYLSAVGHIARYGRNIPLAEDWNFVAPLTGNEPSVWSWAWFQNSEHRTPLARLATFGVLEVVPDLRVVMVLNVSLLAAAAATFILVARRNRGSTSLLDMAFPLLLLHLGHWENLVWAWQLAFVTASVLVLVVLAVVSDRGPVSDRGLAVAGIAIVLMPLTGASALPMVPAALGALAVVVLPGSSARRRVVLSVAGAVSALVVAGYFASWVRPTWTPDNPGLGPTARTTARLLALGWGPAGTSYPRLGLLLMAVLVGAAVVVLARAVRRGGADRLRALALGCYLGGALLVVFVVAYGRAGVSTVLPDRYALLVVPVPLTAWFSLQLLAPRPPRRAVHALVVVVALVALPINIERGYEWRDYYTQGMDAVQRDIEAGATTDEIVARHGQFLLHWDEDALRSRIEMLRREQLGPFAEVERDAPRGPPRGGG